MVETSFCDVYEGLIELVLKLAFRDLAWFLEIIRLNVSMWEKKEVKSRKIRKGSLKVNNHKVLRVNK